MAYDDEYDRWLRDDLGENDPPITPAPIPAAPTGGEAPYGISFWQNRGYTTDQMFNPSGQMNPGWTRTQTGYMFEPPVTPPQTGGGGGMTEQEGRDYDARNGLVGGYMGPSGWVSGSPRGSGGYDGGGGGGGFGLSAAPAPGGFAGWPSYTPHSFDAGPTFTYRDFVAPSSESMMKEPGFQFRIDQGRKALEASAAGKGVLRSGGTLKDILGYGQNFAAQEYGNVYNRALNEYDTNRANAADIWSKQYGQRKDQYSFGEDSNRFGFNAKQRQSELDFQDLFNRWQQEGNWLRDLSVAGMD